MNSISAIIIAKNEEEMITDCIESLKFCSEILLISNNSTDKTNTIAKNLGATVYEINSNDFSEIRGFGLRMAKNDWLLYVDADERIDINLKTEIIESVKKTEYAAFWIRRKNYYLGKNEWPKIEYILRLFKKESLIKWVGEIHESPQVEGRLGKLLKGYIVHFTHRDLSSMVNKTNSWSDIEAEIRFKNNHPQMSWWRFPRVMLTAFIDSYIFQKGYKLKTAGLIESVFQAFSIFITYAKLWEMQTKPKNKKIKT